MRLPGQGCLGRLAWATLTLAVAPTVAMAWPLRIADDRGRDVVFNTPPGRVVSLLPSLSETVCALGRCKLLVGVDRYSNFPTSLQKLPQLGGGLDPSIEAVVAQRPDLVLIATSSRASERLEALGLKVLALEPKTHADVRRVLETLGAVLDVPDPLQVWRGIDAEVAAVAKALPERARQAKVFVPVSAAPHGAGEASFLGETLQRLGARNNIPRALSFFHKHNPELL